MTKKALSLKEFAELQQEEQFELLHRHGVYVGKRKQEEQSIVLFQLHGFYVEVYYKEYRKHIAHIETSASTDIVQPYLEQINIRDLNAGKSGDE